MTVHVNSAERLESQPQPQPLTRLPGGRGLAQRLREMIRSSLGDGVPGVAAAAAACGVSTRTLQRQLRSQGISYRKLVDQVRLDRVLELLLDRELRMIDIALEAGYSEQANFNRAFRRWTGLAPGEARRHLGAPGWRISRAAVG